LNISIEAVSEQIRQLQSQGKTVMVVTRENRLCGLMTVADELKTDSKEAIREMQDQGLKVVMLTGDNLAAARSIGKQVHIDDIIAEVKPDEKSSKVKELREKGERVGMVGDGINDAPALAQADVGIALGTGTDVAMETAGVTLMRGDLRAVPQALALSQATMRTIKQNLFWAFFYNVILIPVAAGALYPVPSAPDILRQLHPVLAAFAMAFSSVTVVSNSLRLRGVRL
jgi:Cu+-exporting ATPase